MNKVANKNPSRIHVGRGGSENQNKPGRYEPLLRIVNMHAVWPMLFTSRKRLM